MNKPHILDYNKSALDFHISNVERMNQLCDPLKYLGITTFGYMKMFEDSTYLHLCNHDKWSRYYLQNIHDTGEVFSRMLAMVDSEITTFIWPNETRDRMLLDLKRYNIFHGFTFYRRTKDYIEHWSFCTNPNNTEIYDLYFKHKELLWRFVKYFCDEADDLVDHSDPRKLAKYKNGNNITPKKSSLMEGNIKQYLHGIQAKQNLFQHKQTWAFLSDREQHCLKLISRGLTQKKIAEQMGIYPSIIDYYLSEIKRKFNVISTNELLEAFGNSHSILENS